MADAMGGASSGSSSGGVGLAESKKRFQAMEESLGVGQDDNSGGGDDSGGDIASASVGPQQAAG